MSRVCPSCGMEVEVEDRFCTGCGAKVGSNDQAAPPVPVPGNCAPLPSLSETDPPPPSTDGPSSGMDIVVEVESNRRHVHNHASLLRFRVTNNSPTGCDVTMQMKLYGSGRFVEQDDDQVERSCRLTDRGDQRILSFPFRGLIPGQIAVQLLQVTVVRQADPGNSRRFELPDQSLLVQVSDPTMPEGGPGIAISGGIHLDFSQLTEMYGSDIKNILNLNAERSAAGEPQAIGWQPIRLDAVATASLPETLCVRLPGNAVLDLVRIRAGHFVMGSPDDQGKDDEWPAHRVSLTQGFYIGKYPVTQEQYQAIIEQNPSKFPLSGQHPVDNVSWDEAGEFCRRLMSYLRQSPGALGEPPLSAEQVSLPTEAQWEHACRAGSDTLYSFGDDRKQLSDHGWFDKNSGRTTQPVGQLKPNPWGVHDMHGNVWEWCEDFYTDDYSQSTNQDLQAPDSGHRRVLRGGSWSYYAKDCRSARRHSAAPDERTANYGFRVIVRITSTK